MDQLNGIIASACLRIERKYINLPLDGDIPIYRERVYCYELYHQMRSLWPVDTQFTLNGEVDKRGHPILRNSEINQIPDLLVHGPGHMDHNHAVIEIKPVNFVESGLHKDMQTLSRFVNRAGYDRAILLIYDTWHRRDLLDQALRSYRRVMRPAPIEIWVHPCSGEPATQLDILYPRDALPSTL